MTLKNTKKNMNILELRDEVSDQKLTNQAVLFKGEIDLDGKPVETILLFRDVEAVEDYLVFRRTL